MSNTDWTIWRGGECPVSPDMMVEVVMRIDVPFFFGEECPNNPERADSLRWTRTGSLGDIVGYRVVSS